MKSSKFTLILILLFSQFAIAQELTSQLTDYFKHHRETIYLHLNKSSYVNGESVWFQGYVLDRKINFLSTKARNAYVQIFDEKGNEINQHMYLVNSGTFEGTFELSEDYAPGKYFLVSQTKWMQNFKESDVHIQSFEVLGESEISTEEILAYDLQIMPEGGHLVEGLNSNIGIKLIDQNGKGVAFEAQLVENNKTISTTKSNFLGITKMSVKPTLANNYTLKAMLDNGKIIEKKITDIKQNGVVLSLNTLPPQQVIVSLRSNFVETENLKPEDHRVIVNQEGKFFEIPINASGKQLHFTFSIANENLFYGVNTITYFYKNQPIAERLFFHYPPNLSSSNSVMAKATPLVNKDSIYAEIDLMGIENKFAKMSVSILPEQTITLRPSLSLASNLYLSPYVKGHIENPSYYFENVNRKKEAEMDYLLLTQGWSRYNWDDVFSEAPIISIPPENGISSRIIIKNNLNKDQKQLLVQSTTFHESMVYDIPENKIVDLANNYLIQGERLTMSLVGRKKKLQNFKRFDFEIDFELIKDSLPKEAYQYSLERKKYSDKNEINVDNVELKSFDNSEVLNEVIIESSIAKKQDFYQSEQEDYQFGFDGKFLKVTEDEAQTYTFLADYLNYSGFRVYDNLLGGLSIINNRGGGQPLVVLNNSRMFDLTMLSGMRLDQFESVYYDKTGFGAGVEGQSGVIRLQLRKTPIFNTPSDVTNSTISTIVDEGFQPIPEYYMPAYGFFDSESFRKVGAIDFKTNLTTDKGIVDFQFFDTKLPNLIFYIDGITENGGYIQLEVPVSIQN